MRLYKGDLEAIERLLRVLEGVKTTVVLDGGTVFYEGEDLGVIHVEEDYYFEPKTG